MKLHDFCRYKGCHNQEPCESECFSYLCPDTEYTLEGKKHLVEYVYGNTHYSFVARCKFLEELKQIAAVEKLR